jgi:hypothetical protein
MASFTELEKTILKNSYGNTKDLMQIAKAIVSKKQQS